MVVWPQLSGQRCIPGHVLEPKVAVVSAEGHGLEGRYVRPVRIASAWWVGIVWTEVEGHKAGTYGQMRRPQPRGLVCMARGESHGLEGRYVWLKVMATA